MNQEVLDYLKSEERIPQLKFEARTFYAQDRNKYNSLMEEAAQLEQETVLRRTALQHIPKSVILLHRSYFEGLSNTTNFWYTRKEIRVYYERGVPQSWIDNTIDGVNNAFSQVGLCFKVADCTLLDRLSDERSARTQATGSLDIFALSSDIARDLHMSQSAHGVVLVLNPLLPARPVIEGSFGIGDFGQGYVTMWRNSKTVSMHEAGHLLSVPANHGEPAMSDRADGYDVSSCVMWWQASYGMFCRSCLDHLRYFWKGIEDQASEQYFTSKMKL